MKLIYKKIFMLVLLAMFTGCGTADLATDRVDTNHEKSSLITDENFVKIANYHYVKATSNLRVAKKGKLSRASYPGEKRVRSKSHEKDVLYISATTPFDKYVQSLNISYNDKKIHLDISDGNVVVTYFDGLKTHTKNLTLQEFLQTNQPVQIKGE